MNAATAARERQLDWLLDEVLGGVTAAGAWAAVRPMAQPGQLRWLVAALITLAVAVAFGVALLHRDTESAPAQSPEPAWIEVHSVVQLDATPADARALRCFDFNDTALALLQKFTRLERLDLGGMDVNEQGYSIGPQITDAGLQHLGKLANLRWLSLANGDNWKGAGLAALEQLPLLEHLDLSHTCVDSAAIERLPRLPSLRELSLSWCLNFHGRSLADVAKIPGLRRLELRGCATVSAADALQLAKLSALRHLDLRDCQGRFRGQTADLTEFNPVAEAPTAEPPKQDGTGITDAVVAGLAKLKLETFLLGGSESLTDAIGIPLASMSTLRSLDLSNLPKTTGDLLARVPTGLTALALDENPQFDGAALRRLPALPSLHELGLSGLRAMTDRDLEALLQGKPLQALRLGGPDQRGHKDVLDSAITSAAVATVARQGQLRTLDLSRATWVDASAMRAIAKLPELAELNLFATPVHTAEILAPLAGAKALRSLKLTYCPLEPGALQALTGLHLEELDLYGSRLDPAVVREAAKAWSGCAIKLANGQRYDVPK